MPLVAEFDQDSQADVSPTPELAMHLILDQDHSTSLQIEQKLNVKVYSMHKHSQLTGKVHLVIIPHVLPSYGDAMGKRG